VVLQYATRICRWIWCGTAAGEAEVRLTSAEKNKVQPAEGLHWWSENSVFARCLIAPDRMANFECRTITPDYHAGLRTPDYEGPHPPSGELLVAIPTPTPMGCEVKCR
jgi:hypothetical protein